MNMFSKFKCGPRSEGRATGIPALVALSGLLLFTTQIFADRSTSRSELWPGTYVIWATADDATCKYVKKTVNALPGQRVSDASERGTPGVEAWVPGPVMIERQYPGQSPYYYPVTHLKLDLDGSGSATYVLRFTRQVNQVNTDSIYVVERVPTSIEEMENAINAREPSFAPTSRGEIVRAQALYGKKWEQWALTEQSVVTVLPGEQLRSYFLAETSYQSDKRSSRILVFVLDKTGARTDICMLRRVCNCTSSCEQSLNPIDRPRLRPSRRFCKN